MEATGYEFRGMTSLVADARAWGLITVTETTRGKLPVTEHRLTNRGREVADHAIRAEAAAIKSREEAEPKESP